MKYHVEMTVFVGMDIDIPDYVKNRSQAEIEQWVRDQAETIYYDPDDQVTTYIDLKEINYKHRIAGHTLIKQDD